MFGGFFKGGSGLSNHTVGNEIKVHGDGGTDQQLATRAWRQHAGTNRNDGESVCVFRLPRNRGDAGSTRIKSGLKCYSSTKRLRHPHILRFIDGVNEPDQEVLFVTDDVTCLADWLETPSGADSRNLAWGVYCVLQALEFLHASGQVHGNVTPDSIYVTNAGDWKLWGFDLVTHLAPGSSDEDLAFFRANEGLVEAKYRSPERVQRDWDGLASNKVGAADVWALAEVARAAYARSGGVPRELEVWTRRMGHADGAKRPSAEQVLRGCPLFRQPFLTELVALQNVSATSIDDQVAFYRKLDAATARSLTDGSAAKGALDETLWRGACIHKLLPRLLATLEIGLSKSSAGDDGDASARVVVASALPLLVQIVEIMAPVGAAVAPPANEAKALARVVSALEQVLVLKDAAIRFEALKRVEALVPLLSADFINRKLFDALLLGFGDESDEARLRTLMAMLAVAPKLNEKNRNDRLLRVVKRLESDKAAKIRTNVHIFYGRLTPELSENLRTKHVLPALLKALEDPTPHVRLAAIRSLGACKAHFSHPLIAARHVAPKLVPLVLDDAAAVRDAAAPCLESYLALLRAEAERMSTADAARAKQLQADRAAAALLP
eukprot:CAMPEP_0184107042 /NCGR_PEP_ID=MMETSP0974-20121125/15680_1 /TAXON_ID=483370 /ORGANISM="non described non described, Strain CCMP2097" /LENGTH=608 /DNA_ID=CAMNT_0026410061 /DNA_START=69 /DNA_END=1891 /DNA_ORIENTATION=+